MPCDSRCARSLSETVLLTSQSASWVSQPSEAWGWFSELFLQEVAQAIEQLALQCVPGRCQGLARIAAEFLGDRCLVRLHDQFAEHAGMLVLAGQHVQQRGPEVGIAGEPVEDARIEQPGVEQPGGGAVQPVFALLR